MLDMNWVRETMNKANKARPKKSTEFGPSFKAGIRRRAKTATVNTGRRGAVSFISR